VTFSITGGTDIVTGQPLDFSLTSAVTNLPPSDTVICNINPLSTLAVRSTILNNGNHFSAVQLESASQDVSRNLGFSLPSDFNPITTVVDSSNIADVVRANEAAAELIRRTNVSVGLSMNETIDAIASDLTDGNIDGQTAIGVIANPIAATVAAAALIHKVEISVEVLANQLIVTDDITGNILVLGVDSTVILNNAVQTTQPSATGSDADVSNLIPTQTFLDQANAAIAVANSFTTSGPSPELTSLRDFIGSLSADVLLTPTQITQLNTILPSTSIALDDAENTVTTASSDELLSILSTLIWDVGNWNLANWK
jgi:hypothetical protein